MIGTAPQLNNNNQESSQPSQPHSQPTAEPNSQVGLPSYFDIKINQASGLKNEGNTFFKENRFQQARNKYQEALQMLEPSKFYGASEGQCHKMAELSANLLFNVATCFFNESKWKEAELIYNEAITVNPYYVKALYKRALARFYLNEYETAMADIKLAHSYDEKNANIKESYEMIRLKYNEEKKKQKEEMKKMSSKIFNSSERSQKGKQGQKKELQEAVKEKKDGQSGNVWWMLPLVPLAAAVIYQGIKYFRK